MLLSKKYRTEKNKHVICRPSSVRITKDCPQPVASGLIQDLGHSFSQYGLPGREITIMYYTKEEKLSPVHVSVKNMSSIEMSPRKDDPTTPSRVI